jgi:putative transposase
MTVPRQVLPGRTHLLTRRCTQRQYLLRPDALVRQTYEFCLAEAGARYGITVFAWIAMSNHQHLLIRDNLGNFPEFMAHLNKMLAKSLNAHWGRWENLWSSEQPNAVYLVEAEDRFAKLIYLLANPVADHLVDRVADWPGACALGQVLTGAPKTVRRPRGFFREDGPMPETVTLRAERLEGFEHLSAADWAAKVATAVRLAEEEARRRRVESKMGVLGRKAVLAAKPTDQPHTVAPRRGLRPHIACRDLGRKVRELGLLRAFRAIYSATLRAWRSGERDLEFPAGTYRMLAFGVRTASPLA